MRVARVRRLVPFALLAGALALLVLAPADATAPGPVGEIVFVDGTSHISVTTAGGTVDHSTQIGTSPTWAPDGVRIAFVSLAGAIEIMSYDPSGHSFTTPAAVAGTTGVVQSVSWSPNGTLLAYSNGTDVRTIATDGTGDKNLTNSGGAHNTDPAWSPDGTRIAFTSDRDGNTNIYVMSSSDGSAQTQLTTSGGADSQPSWSPDDSTIAFTSHRDGVDQVYEVPASGGADVRTTNETVADSHPTWSPSGSQIAFVHNGNLATMTSSGSSITDITGPVPGTQPEWGLQFGVITQPSISASGSLAADTVLTANPGTWSGPTQPPAFGYQWKRCDSSGSSCSSISGATSSTYTLTTADGGSTIRVTVTATESGGSSTATSPPTGVVASASPANTALPKVVFFGAAPIQGTAVSASVGTWSGTTPFTYSYQWERCSETGTGCTLTGATASTYTPTADDVGHTLRVLVKATNSAGSATAESDPTPKVGGLAPAPVVYPTTSAIGQTLVGRTLTATIGTWSGQQPITFTYNWQRCDASFNCTDILGANTTTFVIPLNLVGWRIAFDVRATNSQGNGEARSTLTGVVAGDPPYHPYNQALPIISGKFAVQQQVAASTGGWTGMQPMSFSYQWRRCDSGGNNCANIPGASDNTYVLAAADEGRTIRVVVTASNIGGTSVPLSSDRSAVVGPRIKVKPVVQTAPAIVGLAVPGKVLLLSDGSWTGTMPMTFAHHWRRCDATGAHCKTVPKRVGKTYVVTRRDVGYTIRGVVTAKNMDGATSAITAPTDSIALVAQPRGRRIIAKRCGVYLAGGAGDDTIKARCGNNTLLGGAGNDLLIGGPGNDVIDGGPGQDRILGGAGSDTINAADGEKDVVDCGPGNDRASVDPIDVVINCEKVDVVAPPTKPPTTTGTTTTVPTTTTKPPTTTGTTTTVPTTTAKP